MHADPTPGPAGITVLSYNLWQGRAQPELAALVDAHDPDVLCIQEASAFSLPRRLGGMELAIVTAGNRLAIAIYVRSSRFEVESASSFQLTISRHDRLVGGTGHRLVGARVLDRVAGRRVVLGSFHATPFTDSNAVRRLQVDDAQDELEKLGPGLATVMAGDYNHPILLFMLRHHLKRRGLSLARTSTSTFHKDGNIMRGKFDLATASQFVVTSAVTLQQGASDHKPVLFRLHYSAS